VGHQFFALQTTLKPALGMASTPSNEKPRVSAICRRVSEGGRAKMQNCLNIISNAREMIENEQIFICQRSDDEFIITDFFSTVNPPGKTFFSANGPKNGS